MKATDPHECKVYGIKKMTVAACVSRYLNATSGVRGADSYRAGCHDINCRNCAVGKRLAAELPKSELADYKAGLRGVRIKAIRTLYGGPPEPERQVPPETVKTEDPMTTPAAAEAPRTKVCSRTGCPSGGTPQPLSEFDNSKKSRDGKAAYCKTCRRRMQNESRERIRAQKQAQKKKAIAARAGREIRRETQAAAESSGGRTNIDRLADMLSARGGMNRDQLVRVRILCAAVAGEIDTYLQLHAIFNGGKEARCSSNPS